MGNRWIEPELYRRIKEVIPILTVDIVVVNDLNEVLMLERVNEPSRGEFWMAGGRVWRNEFLGDAAKRKLSEETGLKPASVGEPLGIVNMIWEKVHTPSVVFTCRVKGHPEIKLDGQSSSYAWRDAKTITVANGYHKWVVEEVKLALEGVADA